MLNNHKENKKKNREKESKKKSCFMCVCACAVSRKKKQKKNKRMGHYIHLQEFNIHSFTIRSSRSYVRNVNIINIYMIQIQNSNEREEAQHPCAVLATLTYDT